ncbi:MAG: Glycosyl transferase, group 2 family protein [Candidatus Gallionella acididurans]|uniref:Glycosyl transferase, group 2 family protein n=1 Tax=Candidatus Gallionella acididurans TaxID=1796491 RepID=A0A139BSY3_9PROT|nr:MAG: Glycosyl transferase, group 2 family protein [Candidatus Gallionella acididurans]
MNSELVSIVMATYNGEKFLRKQLDSILGQTYQNFELIVVDDASTDNTLSILNEYAALYDRIHVFPAEKNLGLVSNFERGLRLAKGEYIALSDQDDIFRRDKIELLLATLKDHPGRDLVLSDLSLIDENDAEFATSLWRYQKLKPQQGKPFRRLIYLNFATGCAMMFRRRLLQIALPFPQACLVHDWWLAVVSASSKAGGIYLVSEQLTAYRKHSSNVLGAIEVNSNALKLRAIIDRIKSPSGGIPIFDKRMIEIKLSIARLDGYLRKEFWSRDERLMIEKLKDTFEGYLTDTHSSLLSRVIKLPQRVRFAVTIRSLTHFVWAIFSTIWPYK